MSEVEMKDDVETEEFIDELSDEVLDREDGGKRGGSNFICMPSCMPRAVTDR